ncbi:hypothetical protein CGLO_10115 [Colletotrichum gloeosporioides Cg-14]
MCSEH